MSLHAFDGDDPAVVCEPRAVDRERHLVADLDPRAGRGRRFVRQAFTVDSERKQAVLGLVVLVGGRIACDADNGGRGRLRNDAEFDQGLRSFRLASKSPIHVVAQRKQARAEEGDCKDREGRFKKRVCVFVQGDLLCET